MDLTLLRETVTVVSFITFIGIVLYALAPANRRRFDQAAWMAVEDERVLASVVIAGDGHCAQPPAVDSPSQWGPRGEEAKDGQYFANQGHR